MLTDFSLKELRAEALNELASYLDSVYTYHNAEHTREVSLAIDEFTEVMQMTPDRRFILQFAALFHDFGYLDAAENNEALALPYMQKYALRYNISENVVNEAYKLILETAFPYQPSTFDGKLLCDADIEYTGSDDFIKKALLFRTELSGLGKEFSEEEWWMFELEFLHKNAYFTDVCRQLRESGRLKNLERIEKIIANLKG